MSANSIPGPKLRRKKNVKKGIQFCLMVCGASGTGRTTFVNTLCQKAVLPHLDSDAPPYLDSESTGEPSVKIKPVTVELELDEEGTRVSLTIVDTPGFGDHVDNEAGFGEISSYLERQYDDIVAEESRIKRNPRFRDNRVHVLLYFVQPTGHGLRELDIELMRRLSPLVNVIPVIGKADSLTPLELAESKKLIMEDIEHYRIPVYNFPYDIEEDDEDTVEENAELRGLMPFAIVGSEEVVEVDGRRVRARQYPWGTVEVDNPRHSDFLAIRSALLHSHLADLKEITHDFLYENYRTQKLSKSVTSPGDSGSGQGGVSDEGFLDPQSLASQSVRLKEEQLRREEEKLREIEVKVQREINEKRQELLARESQLKELESRMQRDQTTHDSTIDEDEETRAGA
ncbi:Cell division control protein 11 [Extremus antarcticus]|uniref:Cell division control protein 11 n=1 Tax=Extremus antarcticus TaxID=702011 RepID=A0AAJ0LX69_9PEZI|nr:Cell division control protein 11 [Extremus antarcticus]